MTVLVLVVGITICISAACSLFEATLYSTRLAALEAEKQSDRWGRTAQRFIDMKFNISVPIASILILNTLSNTGGATLAGMYAGKELGPESVPAFSLALTLGILFFSEIMPKTLGAVHWRTAWRFIVWPLTAMNYALYPAILITQWFSRLIIAGSHVPSVTEDEILAIVRMGAVEGQISHKESRLMHNIIALESCHVKEIMTPRTVVFSLDATLSIGEAVEAVEDQGFTRIPIYEGDRENITGYIITHELLSARTLKHPEQPLTSIAKAISFIPETSDAFTLLTTAIQQRQHIYVVVDEYGGVEGLITLEDLLEELLGDEIVDETDRVVDLQEKARKRRRQRPSS
jgi:CBS domain containing-hemolysin-like protein